ncbi:MAG: signal peptidase II [Anaerolineae bacterium]|nr:signal peptidase II [Anaerolineae bacterium]
MTNSDDEIGRVETENPTRGTAHFLFPASDEPARKPSFLEKLVPFIIMAVILLLDQLSKYLVETRIPLYSYWAPIPALENLFRLTHTANTGAVFGLFQGTGMFFAALAVFVAGAIIYFNLTLPGGQWLLRIALGLQLGGALGNLIDRLRQGHVTDFIDVGPWYIFNIADMAVVGGVILFGIVLIREERKQQKNAPSKLNPADTQE